MKDDIIKIVIAIIGSGALTAVISNLFAISALKKKNDQGLHEGVQILLYSQIKSLCRGYIHDGLISIEDYEDLIRMYNIYHDKLDGNGFLDNLMAQVKGLKMVEHYDR